MTNEKPNPGPEHAIIVGRHIRKTFFLGQQSIEALVDVSLHINKGHVTAIMGPSGSGKSTLLYLLGGLDRATAGEIYVAGYALSGMNAEELARFRRYMLGFVFQAFHLVPTMTALENVALPGVFAGIPRELRERRAARLLRGLKMGDRFYHRPAQLSGGQQQRVAIARALFNNPPIILADEPTGALDSHTGSQVLRLLRDLSTRMNKAVVVVTHDPAVLAYADHVLQLEDGRIVT